MMIPGNDNLRDVVISFGFKMFSEERLNQELGGWGCMVLNSSIFHWFYKLYGANV